MLHLGFFSCTELKHCGNRIYSLELDFYPNHFDLSHSAVITRCICIGFDINETFEFIPSLTSTFLLGVVLFLSYEHTTPDYIVKVMIDFVSRSETLKITGFIVFNYDMVRTCTGGNRLKGVKIKYIVLRF